jgi:gliding motility-associated-like protein
VKNDLNHIDEIFKNSLENFEANVDPSVWANVSQSIGNTAGATSAAGGAAVSAGSKSILLYAAASIIATATVIGSVYLLNSNPAEKNVVKNEIKATSPISEEVEVLNVLTQDEKTIESAKVEESSLVVKDQNLAIEKKSNDNQSNNTLSSDKADGEQMVKASPVLSGNTSDEVTVSSANKQKEENIVPSKVLVVEELKVSIRSNVKKGKAPLDVEFSVDGDAVSFLWDFGDNTSISSEETPYHTFKKPGTYKVALTAIDKNANSKISYQLIEVEKNKISKLDEIQNVFSPNGDGINDIIKVDGENISKFHASVLDSKGNLIYEWDSIDGFWDGRDNNNNIIPKGTYYLVVTATGEDGEQHIDKKSIQLY